MARTPEKSVLKRLEGRVSKCIWKLISKEPMLGFLLVEIPIHIWSDQDAEAHGCRAAATDYRRIFLVHSWCDRRGDKELVFILAHEAAHLLFVHRHRQGKRLAERWNVACDYAINGILLDSIGRCDAEMPFEEDAQGRHIPMGLHCAKYNRLTSEQIYERLPGATGENWDMVFRDKNEEEAPENKDVLRPAIARALQRAKSFRANRGIGTEAGNWEIMAEEGYRPNVNWLELLKMELQRSGNSHYTWRLPNKRFLAHQIYLPRQEGMSHGILGGVIDTSGSMMKDQISQCLAEVNQLLAVSSNVQFHLWTCDTAVKKVGVFNQWQHIDIAQTPLMGGGGTDFRPAFQEAERVPGLHTLLYCTDTAGVFPEKEPRFRTFWVVPDLLSLKPDYKVPFGKMIAVPINN